MAKFIHKRLARHAGVWRVDGVGPIQDRGRLGARVVVYFSGIHESSLHDPYRKPALTGETLHLNLHVASLREFKVGTIWRDGGRVRSADPLESREYSVDVSRARLVALDERVKLDGVWAESVIPEFQFRFGVNRQYLALTNYVIVPVIDNPTTQWLVIPCSELLRFYTGMSSRFLASALQGRFDNYVDWSKCRLVDDRPVVHVKQRLNRKEAAILARAVASVDAKEALLGTHKHLSALQVNNNLHTHAKKPLTIRAKFPFQDQTKLVVAGKKICIAKAPYGGADQWGIFVMELLHCSHSFGFSRYVLESEDPFDTKGLGIGGGGGQPPQYFPFIEDDEQDELELDDVPADAKLVRLAVRNYTNQFGGLDFMEIEHWRPHVEQATRQLGAHIEVAINALTLENGVNTDEAKGNLGVSEFQNRVEQIDRDLSLFLEMLTYLRQASTSLSWSIHTKKFGDGLVQGGECIALFPDKVGKRRTWHKIIEPNGNIRPRQVVIAEVVLDQGRCFYLLEMELKSGESGQCTIMLHTDLFSGVDEETFYMLLRLTAIQNRWPDKHNKWKESSHAKDATELFQFVQMHRINHPPVPRANSNKRHNGSEPKLNPEVWSKVLLEKITELLSFG